MIINIMIPLKKGSIRTSWLQQYIRHGDVADLLLHL